MTIAMLQDTDDTQLEHALEVGLSEDEFERAKEVMGKVPNKVELGVISAMWSEHCSYKSSRLHLAKLPSEGDNVIVGPGENAGILDVGDGFGVCFKVESHNHPSYIEPVQGAATGVGGILRDVFTMGARPIAAGNLLRFGAADHKKTPHLLRGVVQGISDYGNCFGVPTVYSDVDFDSAYNGNILVNAFALGVVKNDQIFLGRADGTGNPIFYVGAKTGRDGIHGATMASDSFSEDDDQAKRPTVQVGDPFKEKLLLEACQACFAEDVLIGIQDMGAAGLTSSIFEMASRSGSGVKLHLDLVPTRETGMTAYEKMLSESQERMVLVAKQGAEARVQELFHRWGLDCVQVGEVTDDGMVRLFDDGVEVGVLPARPLADEAPKYDRPHERAEAPAFVADDGGFDGHAKQALVDAGRTNLDWVYEQYDRHVGVMTLVDGAQAPAAVVQIPSTNKAVTVALVCQGRKCSADAHEGGAQAVYEGALRAACMGAKPLGVSDCLNFGNPQVPTVMQTLVDGIEGLGHACRELGIPVVSGNVSLYNETDGVSIHPTPTVAMVGLVDNLNGTHLHQPQDGEAVWLVGAPATTLEGSRIGAPSCATWAPADVAALVDKTQQAVHGGQVSSANVTCHAGLWQALVETAVRSGLGVDAQLDVDGASASAVAFGANAPSVVVTTSLNDDDVRKAFAGLPVVKLGTVGGDSLQLRANGETWSSSVADVIAARGRRIQGIAEGDGHAVGLGESV